MLCTGCKEEKSIKAKGLCNKCYMRVQRHDDVSWERKKKGNKLCSYCHEKPVHAKGFCANCYVRYLKNGSPERVKIRIEKRCSFCGKIDFLAAKGLCKACYKRAREHSGNPAYIEKDLPPKIRACEFCGETKEIAGNGLCGACYQRKWKRGTPKYAPVRVRNFCTIEGCNEPVVSNGLCEKHRNGTPDRCRQKKNRDLIKRFGMTIDDYEKIHNDQGGICAICGQPETLRIHKKTNGLAVDHCHETGQVRGLLCSKCNLALGGFQDSTDLLTKAIDYLKQHE